MYKSMVYKQANKHFHTKHGKTHAHTWSCAYTYIHTHTHTAKNTGTGQPNLTIESRGLDEGSPDPRVGQHDLPHDVVPHRESTQLQPSLTAVGQTRPGQGKDAAPTIACQRYLHQEERTHDSTMVVVHCCAERLTHMSAVATVLLITRTFTVKYYDNVSRFGLAVRR